jgi:HSP20 family protein
MGQWNPLHDLVSLQDRMNRLFEDATQRRMEADQSDGLETADWYPAADVLDCEGEYTIAIDLPGIDRATLDIGVDENRLTVKGSRMGQDATTHRAECPRGKFLRTFTVPASVNQGEIKADYKDGVLQIHLPKQAERKAQRVAIKVS